MSIIRIESVSDAKTFVENSGVADWEWGEKASAAGFAAWLRANRSEIDGEDYTAELRAYLVSVGEAPQLFNLCAASCTHPARPYGGRAGRSRGAASLPSPTAQCAAGRPASRRCRAACG